MDDLDESAAHIMSRAIHSDLSYECNTLSVNDLLKNNKNNKQGVEDIVATLIYAMINLRFIGGRKYGGNQHPPIFMMVEVISSNNAFNHLTAFSTPVKEDVDVSAINRLVKHATSINAGKSMDVFAWSSNEDYLKGLNLQTQTDWMKFIETVQSSLKTKMESL
jgi:hypothetical protein